MKRDQLNATVIVFFLFGALVASTVNAKTYKCIEPDGRILFADKPCQVDATSSSARSKVTSEPFEKHKSTNVSEMEQRNAIFEATQRSFFDEDFSQLEKMANGYRTKKSRTPSGIWKLTAFNVGIRRAIFDEKQGADNTQAYQVLETKVKRWMQQFPNSPSAHIAYSELLISIAWTYRGVAFASEVKPENWAPFRKYIAHARIALEQSKAFAAVDPRWYETMLIVARAEGWEREKFEALLNEALEREPYFYETYFQALEYLLPKWHGGLHEIESFAQSAVERTRKQEGRSMYARIYWYASQTQFKRNIFSDSLAVWPRMKDGFEDVVSRYPDAWNINNYAKFACLAKDKPKTKELFRRVNAFPVKTAWSPPSLQWDCMKWAFQP